jgi:hypothetical protein
MHVDAKPRTARPQLQPALKDLDVVRLTRDFDFVGGRIPKGVQGTILQVFDSGRAYQVEFEGPYEAPETVPADVLETDVQTAQR